MKRVLFTAIAVLLMVSGCVPVPLTPAAQVQPAAPPTAPAATNAPAMGSTAALTDEQLKNAEYNSEFTASGKAKLVDGKYEEPAAPGSASKVTVTFVQSATGDLNGDSVADAAVVLATNTGGTGTFFTLEAVINQGGQPAHVATAELGDRQRVNGMTIEGGVITLDMVIHGPNDPLCCPSEPAILKYQLQGNQLVQVAGPTPVAPAPPTATTAASSSIQGIVWQWMSVTNQTTKKTDSVPNPENYTITFSADGTLAGKADCNQFTGTYSQENGFSIKLGASTMAYCGEASLDQQYLKLLGSVAAGGPDGQGNLALETPGGEQRMLFKNGGPAPAAQ